MDANNPAGPVRLITPQGKREVTEASTIFASREAHEAWQRQQNPPAHPEQAKVVLPYPTAAFGKECVSGIERVLAATAARKEAATRRASEADEAVERARLETLERAKAAGLSDSAAAAEAHREALARESELRSIAIGCRHTVAEIDADQKNTVEELAEATAALERTERRELAQGEIAAQAQVDRAFRAFLDAVALNANEADLNRPMGLEHPLRAVVEELAVMVGHGALQFRSTLERAKSLSFAGAERRRQLRARNLVAEDM